MNKRIIDPWAWSAGRGYVQAVEVKNPESTLYCAGQAAVLPNGTSSEADMKTQMQIALGNLEKVISDAGYEPKNIVRLHLFTTSVDKLLSTCFDLFVDWTTQHEVRSTLTAVEVAALYETLSIEIEATLVK